MWELQSSDWQLDWRTTGARDGPLQTEVPATNAQTSLKLLQALILIINGDCVSFFKDSLGIMTTL